MKKILLILLLLPIYTLSQPLTVTFAGARVSGTGCTIDADAQAYIDTLAASGYTAQAYEKCAIDRYVRDIKGEANPAYTTYNIWSRVIANHLYVGTTAAAHKWNLKDLRDLDAAYRLTYPNGSTHSATGMQFNGSNQYANTHIVPSTAFTDEHSRSGAIYIRTNTMGAVTQIDFSSANGSSFFQFSARAATGNAIGRVASSAGLMQVANSDSRGFYGLSQVTTADSARMYKNNLRIASIIDNTATASSGNKIPIGAQNSGGVLSGYSAREYCYDIFTNGGLTQDEMLFLYNAVNALQSKLNRKAP